MEAWQLNVHLAAIAMTICGHSVATTAHGVHKQHMITMLYMYMESANPASTTQRCSILLSEYRRKSLKHLARCTQAATFYRSRGQHHIMVASCKFSGVGNPAFHDTVRVWHLFCCNDSTFY